MADKFQERAIKNVRKRHESQIRENAERIRDHVGYVLARLDAGRSDSVGLYADDISASARRIASCVTALEAVAEVTAIYETTDAE
jgi:actin-like ATPase involved in cell morphogenesis